MTESSSPPRTRPDSRSPLRWVWPGSPVVPLTILALLVTANVAGVSYYALPMAGRVRSPLHHLLRPSGTIGQSAGLLTLALFLFMWLYPIRKRVRRLSSTGSIARWLDVHILVGLTVPWVGALHAGWRFEGLIGLGYVAMVVVSASGVVGKYLYTRIPRSRAGVELTIEEAQAERRALTGRIAAALGLPDAAVEQALAEAVPQPQRRGAAGALLSLLTADWRRWRAAGALRRRWEREAGRTLDRLALHQALRLAQRQIGLTQALRFLEVTQRFFHYWHVAHLPVAITALVAVLIHVGVAIAVGATWLG